MTKYQKYWSIKKVEKESRARKSCSAKKGYYNVVIRRIDEISFRCFGFQKEFQNLFRVLRECDNTV